MYLPLLFHVARSEADSYPLIGAQLKVTGGGGKTPSGSYLVSLPGAFSMSDAGVNINIYDSNTASQTTYKVPGPGMYYLHMIRFSESF
jgi:hypothetical protein